ncbi:hypothetical protein VTN96DRAFT_4597 [Rasamsonia emersonii]
MLGRTRFAIAPQGLRKAGSLTQTRVLYHALSSQRPAAQLALAKAPSQSLVTRPAPTTALIPTPQTLSQPGLQIQRWQSTTTSASDYPVWQPQTKGILSVLPPSWVPYAELMRIEKPGGLYGFYFPYLIGLSYAACIAQPVISPAFLASTSAAFLVWNVFLRGAACVINDNFDREFDRQVARCQLRPIARGAVTPLQGHVFYWALTAIGAGLVSQFPHATQCFWHAIPIHALVSLYPLAKRWTDFPQVVLSIPLSWAVFMSCSALGVEPFTMQDTALALATTSLAASQAVWIVIFDYVNACQDTVDDIKAGVRSMAVRYRDTFAFISVLGTAQVGLLVAAGWLAGLSPVYYTVACGGNALWLAIMAKTVNRAKPHISAWWFAWGSLIVGGTTVAGLLAEYGRNLYKGNDLDEQEKVTL